MLNAEENDLLTVIKTSRRGKYSRLKSMPAHYLEALIQFTLLKFEMKYLAHRSRRKSRYYRENFYRFLEKKAYGKKAGY